MTNYNALGPGDKAWSALTVLAGGGDTLNYTDASARKQLPLDPADYPSCTLWIYNDGTGPVFVAFGDATVVSTLNGTVIPPGRGMNLTIPDGATYIAAIAPATGAGSVMYNMGFGSP
jgi:hypothetical protein